MDVAAVANDLSFLNSSELPSANGLANARSLVASHPCSLRSAICLFFTEPLENQSVWNVVQALVAAALAGNGSVGGVQAPRK